MIKSLGLAGFGQDSWQPIACNTNAKSINIAALEHALKVCNKKGKIVIASAATVTGTDYDDLGAISKIFKKCNAWLHVDAAFGIFERLVSGKDSKTKGLEFVDSITLDFHKWLNVPYACGVFLTKHVSCLKESCEVTAPYLTSTENIIPFISLGIENSRRFRAFPVWATLMAYGRNGIKHHIETNIRQAKLLANWITKSDKFELIRTCELNIVLFKLNPATLNITSNECISKLNSFGQVFLTPGSWQGEPIIRAALSNWSTDDNDVEKVIATLNKLEA